VYSPLFHSLPPTDPEAPPSILSMGYHRVIATGSLSKAFALAGIRVGWIASRDPSIIKACAGARDYTTISVSQVDDQIASFALSSDVIHNLLARNLKLAKTNLDILGEFVSKFSGTCSWVRPTAGTTAFVKFQKDSCAVDGEAFCRALLSKTGVLFVPGGKCFGVTKDDFEGYIRIGYACETEDLVAGLKQLEEFLQTDF
jgi:aspartate/methionine/tyrosine aminotransferase